MRKRALITLGCSFTEGVGCYNYEELPAGKSVNNLSQSEFDEYYGTQLDNFLDGSWGTHLQKLLGYDLHINCGIGGSANSHQLKNFMDTMVEWPDLSNYDVLVIWQMTYSHRFSFYHGDIPLTYGFNNTIDLKNLKLDDENTIGSYNNFVKSFVIRMNDAGLDTSMAFESLFYLRCFIDICKSKGYDFLFSTVGDIPLDNVILEYLNEEYLSKFIRIADHNEFHSPLHYAFINNMPIAHCGHPMSQGYSQMATAYFNWITDYDETLSHTSTGKFIQIPMNRDYHIVDKNKRLK